MTTGEQGTPFPWSLFLSEVIGTALLVLVGLSLVIFMFGEGSPIPGLLPDAGVRSAITGFLFGSTHGSSFCPDLPYPSYSSSPVGPFKFPNDPLRPATIPRLGAPKLPVRR